MSLCLLGLFRKKKWTCQRYFSEKAYREIHFKKWHTRKLFLDVANWKNGLDYKVKPWFGGSSKLKTDQTWTRNKIPEISAKENKTDQRYHCLFPTEVTQNSAVFCFSCSIYVCWSCLDFFISSVSFLLSAFLLHH